MTLWGLLTLFYVLISAEALGGLWLFANVFLASRYEQLGGPEFLNIVFAATGFVGLSLLVLALAFYLIIRYVALPVRRLTAMVQSFAETGKREEVQVPKGAPREIKTLIESFEQLAARTAEAHSRDSEISRVKSDFISTAAHQLRTPLTGVRWSLEALEKSGLTEDQKALVQSATEKSHELVAIVGTLLDISSIESGKYQYQFEPLDLGRASADAANDFQTLARQQQVTLYYSPADEQPPVVRADRERIRWVLDNLVENAVRYTPAGGSVQLSIETSGERAFLHVRDTGIGIPESDRGNIFERFYRAGNAIAKENEGNGLGLYIARQIANDHGGDLSFESNKDGPGTTFTLSLPLTH